MPTFEFTGPDGKSYEVDGPEGSTPEQAFAVLQQQMPQAKPPGISNSTGMLRSLASGASFGFADELAGAASALTGGEYSSARDAYNTELDAYRRENPGAAFAGEVGGALLTGIPSAVKAGATTAGRALAARYAAAAPMGKAGIAAATGAIPGAISGAGNADENRALGALSGGVIGGALSGAAVPVAKVVGGALGAVTTPLRWAGEQLTMTPTERAIKKIAEAAGRDGIAPDDIAANLRRLGPQAALVDAGGENVLGLAEGLAQMPGAQRNAARALVEDRAVGAGGRVLDSALENMDVSTGSFDDLLLASQDRMRKIGPQYEPILNNGVAPLNDKLKTLMGSSTMRRNLASAFSILDDDIALGRADAKLREYIAVNRKGEGEIIKEPTLRVWDYVKRGLDTTINDGTDPLTGKLTSQAERAAALKRQLLSYVDEINPDYKRIRSAYADEKGLEAALKSGRSFMREDSEVLARRLADMDPPEQKMFRNGAARAIYEKIMSAEETHTAYRKFAASPLMREKVREIFPTKEGYDAFMDKLKAEATFARTRNVLTGNSRTALRQALQEDAGVPMEAAKDLMSGNVTSGLARVLMNKGAQSLADIPEAMRGEYARLLFSRDPAVQDEVVRGLMSSAPRARPPMLPAYAAPAGLMSLGATVGGAWQR